MTPLALPGVDAEVVARVDSRVKPRPDRYVVLAYNAPGEYWGIPRSMRDFATSETAANSAADLPSCWSAFIIVRIPGEQP